ncbi:Protein kinase-like domain [Pseudocohnilembus persalinus]|uniref:non-specific serine/threonine protein kinase n=1 Tax=Pseudocohnilembus persalinus TaxID=266149 RepID=A0A0V0R9A9_PSEPJ|nr:Protein kinase-like domain [Pseudocohnilembus persalinus]|eukprot:KRX10960.1 Protein kinase-like domain [Pseudocohnilembus persalinus]
MSDNNRKQWGNKNSQKQQRSRSNSKEKIPQKYKDIYKEIELVGKGTSGMAQLVKHKSEKKYYIAKFIKMGSMTEEEKEKAQQELILQKQLKHPNIVEYKESFLENDNLIIIMEYCEDGDLGYHIKRKKAQNQTFKEDTILNWFIQLVMALDFMHQKKIIHRDIKATNIFLSQCGSVKIGDFGISKQLDSTLAMAKTLVGTPYYLSPEVCENKPYTYQSDIWSLGCLLYEMCTLEHPFVSNNLMTILLEKDQQKRPNTKDILCTQFMMQVMHKFINKEGNLLEQVPLKKLNIHQKKETILQQQMQKQVQQNKQNPQKYDKISEMERKILEKEEKIKREMKEERKKIQQEKNQQNKPKSKIELQEEKYEKMMANLKSDYKQDRKELQDSKLQNKSQNQEKKRNSDQQDMELPEPPKLFHINSTPDQYQHQNFQNKQDYPSLAQINKDLRKNQNQIQESGNQKNQHLIQNVSKSFDPLGKTIESVYQSENKSIKSINLDQTIISNYSLTQSLRDKSQNVQSKKNNQKENLENISEQTDEQSENTACQNNSSSNNNNYSQTESLSKQDQNPSIEKINQLNNDLSNPNLYLSNNTFLKQSGDLGESDFNISLTNKSAFNINNDFIQKMKNVDIENVQYEQEIQKQNELQQLEKDIKNNDFFQTGGSLGLTVTQPFQFSGINQSFNVSQKTNFQMPRKNSKTISPEELEKLAESLQNESKTLYENEFLESGSQKFENQNYQQNEEIQHNLQSLNKVTQSHFRSNKNEMNPFLQSGYRNLGILQSKASTEKNDADYEGEGGYEMLEVKDDMGDSSEGDDEREEDTMDEINEDPQDKQNIYKQRITKDKGFKELDDVLNLYKSQLQQSMTITKSIQNKYLNMTEIKETSQENIFSESDKKYDEDTNFDENFKYTCEALKQMENVTHLTLNSNLNQITDLGVQYISQAIKTMTNVTKLTLNLGKNQISDIGAQNISLAIQKLQKITYLSLDIGYLTQ